MSDAKNLNDFFAQHSKKKKNKKAGETKQAKPAAAEEPQNEETKNEAVSAQPEAQTTPAQDFADSSDEESNTIVINEGRKKIIDRKELEASKKSKEEEKTDAAAGWGLGTKIGQVEENTVSKPVSSTAKAPGAGGLSFGKPTFTRKAKGIMDNQDFPDLESANKGGSSAQQEQSKANSSMQFSVGASAKGARDDQAAPEEKRPVATKPVFKGKAKLNAGPLASDEVQTSYDFSRMQISSSTAKKTEGGDRQAKPEGERRGPRAAGFGASFDDDFEVVAEKKKPQRRNFEEPKFGGGMPSFTRGGNK